MTRSWSKIFKYLFWILILVLIFSSLAMLFAIHRFNSSRNLDLHINGPKEVFRGTPFNLDVSFFNHTKEVLYDASISIFLPQEIVGEEPGRVLVKKLGDVGLDSKGLVSFTLVAQSGKNVLSKINVSLSYQPKGLPRVFLQKKKEFPIYIKQPAISVDIFSPEQVLNQEDFELSLVVRNISSFHYKNVNVYLDFPLNFKLRRSEPKISENNLSFSLRPSEEKKIKINASLIGYAGNFSKVKALIKVGLLGREIEINEKEASIKIASSPLNLSLLVNGQRDYVASVGEELTYTINYQNKSEISLGEVRIKARLFSSMFDFKTLNTDGEFNSLNNTIIWHPGNKKELAILSPNEKGSVEFKISLKNYFPIYKLNDRNFTLNVQAEIESPTVPYYLTSPKTSTIVNSEVKVRGKIEIKTLVYFRDSHSLILNTGPFPPRVNKETEYTVHWVLNNYSTEVNNVELRAVLPQGVIFTGKVKSNTDTTPFYNERTKEVIWLIDKIAPAKGILSPSLEAVFQIRAMPSLTMVGDYQLLIGETTLSAFDSFTGIKLYSSFPSVSTLLPDDKTVSQEEGIVRE